MSTDGELMKSTMKSKKKKKKSFFIHNSQTVHRYLYIETANDLTGKW